MPNVSSPAIIAQKASVTVNPAAVTSPSGILISTATGGAPITLTKFQFRKLFTQAERVAIDNIEYNLNVSGSTKALIATFQKDLDVSNVVILNSPDVIIGVNFLYTAGLITDARRIRILSNLQPA